jgi:hypothetical protein
MLTDNQLNAANAYGEWLRLAVHERELPANYRTRAAAACLAIAQDHHHAIVVLLDARLYASVFALVRVTFEAYIRGEWLALCATDAEIDGFLKGEEPPKLGVLLAAIEATPAFNEKMLSQIKKNTWASMCAYTHTGGLHVQRWNTEDGIEPNYSVGEVLEALRFADIIASLSVLGALTLAGDDAMAEQVLERYKTRMSE